MVNLCKMLDRLGVKYRFDHLGIEVQGLFKSMDDRNKFLNEIKKYKHLDYTTHNGNILVC